MIKWLFLKSICPAMNTPVVAMFCIADRTEARSHQSRVPTQERQCATVSVSQPGAVLAGSGGTAT